MIGHHIRFRENGDLLPWRGSAVKKKAPFFNARAILGIIIHSKYFPVSDWLKTHV